MPLLVDESSGLKLRTGPLSRLVTDFSKRMAEIVPQASTSDDWEVLAEFVDTTKFFRIGCFMKPQNWLDYTD